MVFCVLIDYDVSNNEEVRLGWEITNAIYYDRARLLYSDKAGISRSIRKSFQCTKLTLQTTDSIFSDGKNIVYSNSVSLYLLYNIGIILTDNVLIQ